MSKYLKEPLLARFLKYVAQYLLGLTWIWQKILYPIFYNMYRCYKWLSIMYINLWHKVVRGRMSAGLFILATMVMVPLTPIALWTGVNTGAYLITGKYETIYLTSTEEINPEEDIHSVRGCESLPCREENSIYFRVKANMFTHAYAVITRGHLFYPDRVASVIAPGMNVCQVSSYGIRLKALMRGMDIYPYMLDAVCTPYVPPKVN